MDRMAAAAQEMQRHCTELKLYLQRRGDTPTHGEQPDSAHDWCSSHELRRSPSPVEAVADEQGSPVQVAEEIASPKPKVVSSSKFKRMIKKPKNLCSPFVVQHKFPPLKPDEKRVVEYVNELRPTK